MIMEVDCTGKKKTMYKCDRCGVEVTSNNIKGIYVKVTNANPKKRWDLCDKCYKALIRGIEKNK